MKYIIIHCSDSPHGRDDGAEEIHRWHLEKDWSGIGYHHVIKEDGQCQKGRPHYWMGAHCKGYNRDSIGICLIGEGSYTFDQWDTLRILVDYLTGLYPDALVVGHNDLDKNKTCPMFDVKAWYQDK